MYSSACSNKRICVFNIYADETKSVACNSVEKVLTRNLYHTIDEMNISYFIHCVGVHS